MSMTALMIVYLFAIFTTGLLAQSLPNTDVNNTEAASNPNTNSSEPFYTEIPPPSTPPKPPACGLQTQICIQVLPPAYAAPKAGQLPRPFEDPGCTISYTGDNGAIVYSQITALEKRGHLIEGEGEEDDPPVPCGLNIAMKVEGSSYGPFEVEYQKNLNGLPGDPVFRIGDKELKGWENKECQFADYAKEGEGGLLCYYWWCNVYCNA